jgi:hypothetical protein
MRHPIIANRICLGGKGRRCLLNRQRTVQVDSSAGSLVNNGGHWLPGRGRATALLVLLTAAARAGVVAAGDWDGSPRRMARSVVPGTASWILVRHVLSRFSLQTCANRNERHPAPVSYGSVLQHPFRCESAIRDLACLQLSWEDRRLPSSSTHPRG